MMRNEYTVTWKLYREWLIENKIKGIKLFFLLFWSFMEIVILIRICYKGFSVLYLLMTIYCVHRAFFLDYIAAKKQYTHLAKVYGGENWTRIITISDTDIYISEGTSVINYNNTDVVRVKEKDDRIWLDMNSDTVIRLYKSAFVEGSWETCKGIAKW